MKKIIVSLIFGCSTAFTFLSIYKLLNIPYQDTVGLIISMMISIQVVNNREKLIKWKNYYS